MLFAFPRQPLACSSAASTFCIKFVLASCEEMGLFPLVGWYQLSKVLIPC